MNKIGIIAGGGELPILVGKSLIENNFNVVFFLVKNNANKKLYKKFNTIEISLNSLKEILKNLKKNNIKNIVMLGRIQRPSLSEIKFDLETLKFIKNYFLENKGDDQLLISIQKYFYNKGYPLLEWTKYCKNLFTDKNYLTKKSPSKKSILNKNKGLQVFKLVGHADIGQSMIIQNEVILGVEASEGTDELLKRCYKYKKKGDKGVLIKLSKYKQSQLIDIPTIGIETIKLLKKFGYEGAFIESNKCIIINKEETIKYANLNKIFISAVKKID